MLYYRFGTRRRHEWVRREQLGQAFSCRMRTLVEIVSRSSAKLEAAPERNKSLPRKSLKNHYGVYELHQFWTRQAGRARVVSILGLCPISRQAAGLGDRNYLQPQVRGAQPQPEPETGAPRRGVETRGQRYSVWRTPNARPASPRRERAVLGSRVAPGSRANARNFARRELSPCVRRGVFTTGVQVEIPVNTARNLFPCDARDPSKG